MVKPMNQRLRCFVMIAALVLVARADLRAQAVFGYAEPARIAHVAFPESGVLETLEVREGDTVKEGQVLATLDSRILTHELAIANETLRIQKMRHSQMKTLRERENISVEEYERACADLTIAEEQAGRIRAQIENRTLRAPFDGRVIRVFRERAESISPSQAEVMTIATLDVLKLTFNVPLDRVKAYVPAKAVPLRLEGETDAVGIVEFVSPVIDAASRTVRIRLSIANTGGVYRAGMYAVPLDDAVATNQILSLHPRTGTAGNGP